MPLISWPVHLLRQLVRQLARPWLLATLIAVLFLGATFGYVDWLRWQYGFGQ